MRFLGVNPGEHPEFVVVGLGNPGKRYEITRQNVGFKAVDLMNARCKRSQGCKRELHYALTDKCVADGYIIYFAKPQTYINNSGMSVKDILDYYQFGTEKLLVIHDDPSLESGEFKLSNSGDSDHKGVRSIIEHLGTDRFARLRIGVGPKPSDVDSTVFALSKIPDEELKRIELNYVLYNGVVTKIIAEGIESAMKFYNLDLQE